MASNYTKISTGLTITECDLYEYLQTAKGYCCEKGWLWRNDTTNVEKTGRQWMKIWAVTPPSCSGGVAPFSLERPIIESSPDVAVEGAVLTVVSNGVWGGDLPITYSYQWHRGATPVGTDSNTYTIVSADIGFNMTCTVTATNAYGDDSSDSNSLFVYQAPTNTVAPTTTGNDYVGQVLSGTDGTWVGTSPITLTYKWQRDGVDIVGATSSTYTSTSADADKEIRRVVIGTNIISAVPANGNAVYIFTAQYQAVRVEGVVIGATSPSTGIQKKENKILNMALLANLWDSADKMGNFASDGDNLWKSINWKNPSGNKFIFNGGGAMVSLQGYKLNGTNAWIDSRLNLSTATKYTASNCCIGCYSAGENIGSVLGWPNASIWGASDGTNQTYLFNPTGVWDGRMGSGTGRTTTDIRRAEGHYSMEYNGANAIIRIGSTNYTFAQTGAPARPNFNLGYGCRNKTVPDQFAVGTIAFIYAGDATLGAGMRTILDAVMPTIFPTVTPAVLQADFDMNNTAKLWQNTAKTIPATVANDPVRVVEPVSGSWGDLVAAADSERPLIQSWVGPSKLVLDFDGSNDSFDFPSSITGDHTLLWVVKNDDTANGSHILYGQNYLPLTGSSYSGNSSYSGEYFVPHPGGTQAGGIRVKNQSNAYNVIAMKLTGTEWCCMNGLCQAVKLSVGTPFFWSKIGKEYLAGWQLDGKLGRFIYYGGALTDKQLQDLIISLNTTYAL